MERWLTRQGLTFDIRRATHSIGSNVRDAASYVLWSLSRACPPELIKPYADEMATGMICAACFDREVGVRRAASAAYQEGVGRLVSSRKAAVSVIGDMCSSLGALPGRHRRSGEIGLLLRQRQKDSFLCSCASYSGVSSALSGPSKEPPS